MQLYCFHIFDLFFFFKNKNKDSAEGSGMFSI